MANNSTLNKDFKLLLTDKFLEELAESHLEVWSNRYSGQNKQNVRFDLNVNHDPSLEIEYTNEQLKRDMNENEETHLIKKFNVAVVEKYFKY